ncbi:MAG: hypothetical protein UGE23_05165 [Peptococcaceae bacterium]|nr:hypothetical protein [Peptococcaceae bacterium]
MLLKMKKNSFDKYNKANRLKVGDLVEVADEKRAKTMIKVGMAEAVTPKTLTEPKEEPKEETNEPAEAEVVKKVVTRRSKAGAEDKE